MHMRFWHYGFVLTRFFEVPLLNKFEDHSSDIAKIEKTIVQHLVDLLRFTVQGASIVIAI